MIEKTHDLAAAVRAAGISSTSEFYVLVLKLSPAEAALFRATFEADKPLSPVEIRQASGGLLGNLSLTARGLNAKLAAAGDTRRVVNRRTHGGAPGSASTWSLSEPEAGAA